MGCDIHVFIERRVKGVWQKVEVDKDLLPESRNYELFGLLAGVRGLENKPWFSDRGWPRDSCYKEDMNMDFHNHTYFYVDELDKVRWDDYGLEWNYFPIFFDYVLPRLLTMLGYFSDEEKRDIRVCICFDS